MDTDIFPYPFTKRPTDARVHRAQPVHQPVQVHVFYSINELMIENSSKVKARKGAFAKKCKSEKLPLS
jgi:hypothetical protein